MPNITYDKTNMIYVLHRRDGDVLNLTHDEARLINREFDEQSRRDDLRSHFEGIKDADGSYKIGGEYGIKLNENDIEELIESALEGFMEQCDYIDDIDSFAGYSITEAHMQREARIAVILKKAAEYIAIRCASKAMSGGCTIRWHDVPADILPSGMFERYMPAIAMFMEQLESVDSAEANSNELCVIMKAEFYINRKPPSKETDSDTKGGVA